MCWLFKVIVTPLSHIHKVTCMNSYSNNRTKGIDHTEPSFSWSLLLIVVQTLFYFCFMNSQIYILWHYSFSIEKNNLWFLRHFGFIIHSSTYSAFSKCLLYCYCAWHWGFKVKHSLWLQVASRIVQGDRHVKK